MATRPDDDRPELRAVADFVRDVIRSGPA